MDGLDMDPLLANFIFIIVLGNVLGFMGDYVFAKTHFGGVPVPYGAIATRVGHALRALLSKAFVRFGVVTVIDGLVLTSLLEAVITYLRGVRFPEFPGRNAAIGLALSGLSFMLYVNTLRFEWAYADVPGPPGLILDVIMTMWLTMVILFFVSERRARRHRCTGGTEAHSRDDPSSSVETAPQLTTLRSLVAAHAGGAPPII